MKKLILAAAALLVSSTVLAQSNVPLQSANNLSDVNSVSQARANLGLGSVAATNGTLANNSFVYSGSNGALSSTAAATNGQILVGNTGNAPVAASITGATNQISVTNGPGSIALALPSTLTIPGTISSYNGTATASIGVPIVVAQVGLTNQNANISTATLYAVPSTGAGMYRASCYAVETAADGASSTLPNIGIGWTDADSNTGLQANTVTSTNTANAVGAFSQGVQYIYAKGGTNITYLTGNYASGTAGAMKYAMRCKLEYLGS
jgi:hypothetical protein